MKMYNMKSNKINELLVKKVFFFIKHTDAEAFPTSKFHAILPRYLHYEF